jgi:hypothetical protein
MNEGSPTFESALDAFKKFVTPEGMSECITFDTFITATKRDALIGKPPYRFSWLVDFTFANEFTRDGGGESISLAIHNLQLCSISADEGKLSAKFLVPSRYLGICLSAELHPNWNICEEAKMIVNNIYSDFKDVSVVVSNLTQEEYNRLHKCLTQMRDPNGN